MKFIIPDECLPQINKVLKFTTHLHAKITEVFKSKQIFAQKQLKFSIDAKYSRQK